MKKLLPLLFLISFVCCNKGSEVPFSEEDATLGTLLNELDECQTSGNKDESFRLYSKIAAEYEAKNLTELQKHYQQEMLNVAKEIAEDDKTHGLALMSEAYQQLATTYMVEGKLDSALIEGHRAYHLIPKDTVDFRAQTLLLIAQIHLAAEDGDSVQHYIKEAEHVYPKVTETDLYRITRAYGLDLQGNSKELADVLPSYISQSGIHAQAELTRLLMYSHEDELQWKSAYDDATRLLCITDSIAKSEASENTARIHALQHEKQMEHQRAERATERTQMFLVITAIMTLLLIACCASLSYRRKARIAQARELEAMRLSEVAQSNESMVREENIKLQKLYYEHLYAIILPILNANRGKTGHISLGESSWELIEKNTDLVIPGFTSRLRKQHPTLSTEDIRFCCLLMMRVPNAILADVYGIAPSSVAVRKQRMKKKLDDDVQNQTIENYLNQYLK